MEVIFNRSSRYVPLLRPALPVLASNISTSVRCLYCMNNRLRSRKYSENNSLRIISLHNYLSSQNHNFVHQRLTNKHASVQTYSSDSKKCSEDVDKSKEKKMSLFQKMKQMTKDYWQILIPVHVVTSIGWVAIFYTAAKNGVDIISIMEYLHLSERYLEILRSSNAGNWAITYALYKIFTPARYTVTLAGTTVAIKYLSRLGYIKKPSFKVTPTNQNKAVQSQNNVSKGDFKAEQQTEPPKT